MLLFIDASHSTRGVTAGAFSCPRSSEHRSAWAPRAKATQGILAFMQPAELG